MRETHSNSPHAGGSLAVQRVQPFERSGLAVVVCEGIDADGRLSDLFSAYYDDLSPPLGWSRLLEAQSYALIVEDPDAPGDRPFLHWLLWNIPGDADALPGGISREAHPEKLPGAVQGRNGTGSLGWHGPKPPPGHGPHRYHFQIFALSERLDHLDETTSLETLVSALKGLTLASGEAIGVYERADRSLDRPSPGRTGSYGLMAEGPTEAERHAGREGLDEDDLDRHAPHDPEGVVRRST